MSSITKNQHMVPQFIIKKFSEDNQNVWRIKEIKLNDRVKFEIKLDSSASIMYGEYVYELPKEMINEDTINLIEKEYQKIETKYAEKMNQLLGLFINKESNKRIQQFFEDNILNYALVCYLRTAQYMYSYCVSKDKKITEDIIREKRFEKMIAMSFNQEYIDSLKKVITKNYTFHILESANNNFLLSDSFICTASFSFKGLLSKYNCTNRSIGVKDIIILIPVSSRYYIAYCDNETFNKFNNTKIKVYKDEIDFYNSIIYRNSYEFTVGKKELLENINAKTKKYLFPFTITSGYILPREIWVNEKIDENYITEGGSKYIVPDKFIYYYGWYESPLGYYNLAAGAADILFAWRYEK